MLVNVLSLKSDGDDEDDLSDENDKVLVGQGKGQSSRAQACIHTVRLSHTTRMSEFKSTGLQVRFITRTKTKGQSSRAQALYTTKGQSSGCIRVHTVGREEKLQLCVSW